MCPALSEITISFNFKDDMIRLLDAYWRELDDVLLALVLGAGISTDRLAISLEAGDRILLVDGKPFCRFTLKLTMSTAAWEIET